MNTYTPGPWRWEINRDHKSVHLVGGRCLYDLTIMDFSRWGMSGAVPVLRDPAEDGMNVMHRLCDRQDWIAAFPDREHHKKWCADVVHPDMRLMAAAPDLLEALQSMEMALIGYTHQNDITRAALEKCRSAIAKATQP